jgi:hypothetical protein
MYAQFLIPTNGGGGEQSWEEDPEIIKGFFKKKSSMI